MARKSPASRWKLISLRTVSDSPPEGYSWPRASQVSMNELRRGQGPGADNVDVSGLVPALVAGRFPRPHVAGAPAERPDSTTPKNSDVGRGPGGPTRGPRSCWSGTSLTAGYGLDPSQAWATLLQARVDSAGLPFRVVNAGVSGETSAGALRRTDWLFGQGPIRVLVVETGANDGLRGQPVDSLRANLDAILTKAEALTPKPVLVVAGMEAPPNLGRRYAERVSRGLPRRGQDPWRGLSPVPARRCGRGRVAQSGRRHPSQSAGLPPRAGQRLEDPSPDPRQPEPPTRALTSAIGARFHCGTGRSNDRSPMIDHR